MYIPPDDYDEGYIELDDEGYPIPKGTVSRQENNASIYKSKTNQSSPASATSTNVPCALAYKGKAEVVSISCTIIRETDRAILISYVYDREDLSDAESMWIPLSQVKSIHHTGSKLTGTKDILVISRWIAKQKNIIG